MLLQTTDANNNNDDSNKLKNYVENLAYIWHLFSTGTATTNELDDVPVAHF